MKTYYIPVIACILISFTLTAQEKSGRERRGDRYSFTYNYDKAIQQYTRTRNLSVEGQRALAKSYQKTNQYALAEETCAALITTGVGIVAEDYYNYAMALKSNGKYPEATVWMNKFAELRPMDLRAKDFQANKNKLDGLLLPNPEVYIEHQKINTAALDFGTTFFNDQVVFASTRTHRSNCASKYNWTHQPFWDMYVSNVNNGQLQTPERFAKKLNGKLHDGPVSFSNQNTYMAFTRNNYSNTRHDRVIELQIWFSRLTDGKWSKPEPFTHNNQAYSVGHPWLSADGNTMYFTSDQPGGFGGTDIYKTTRSNQGEWSLPENLGQQINTEGDELFPFLDSNSSTFVFASNGRYGLGGLDIYFSTLNNREFSSTFNPGSPLNTQFDDFAAIIDGTMSQGYFTTNRPGGSGGDDIYSLRLKDPDVVFTVDAPTNQPVVRTIRETFPLRNYVFFTKGSTQLPERYVSLTKAEAVEFKEDQLEEFTPKNASGHSARQMNVYYNIINIVGNRLSKFPSATINLVGSSENGSVEGKTMANTVKSYLVDIFGISAGRIKTEGRVKPILPSEKEGGVLELTMLREGDQRVTIESTSPAILMEFLSGPDAPIKPVKLTSREEPILADAVQFNVAGANNALTSWSMDIKNADNKVQHYGPYTEENISINRLTLAGRDPKGNLKATMTGKTKMGKTITKEAVIVLKPLVEPKVEEVHRFSIIYEFDDAKAIRMYEKYLTEVVAPKIPRNGKVIIRGYTDIIGDQDYNQNLSLARANDVKEILLAALGKSGRKDVRFDVRGDGENNKTSPFENKHPEERFYNRTVIIDIAP
ncbi:MAG: OmpA family protein [Paludibacter sp.]|jgi:outer membrane protein OmpA-like peptidoglycan-associated protein|nr:OmpA family protein [Paludibacter sp.]